MAIKIPGPMNDMIQADRTALALFDEVRGRIALVTHLMGYIGDDSRDFYTTEDNPFRVLIREDTREDDVLHQVDEFIDPYWDVELLNKHPEVPSDARSFWVFGPSIKIVPDVIAGNEIPAESHAPTP